MQLMCRLKKDKKQLKNLKGFSMFFLRNVILFIILLHFAGCKNIASYKRNEMSHSQMIEYICANMRKVVKKENALDYISINIQENWTCCYGDTAVIWYAKRGLLDSVKIILDNKILFQGTLKNFYEFRIRLLTKEITYFNSDKNQYIELKIFNYSRNDIKLAKIPLVFERAFLIYDPLASDKYLQWGQQIEGAHMMSTECFY